MPHTYSFERKRRALADRAYRGLTAIGRRKCVSLDIKAPAGRAAPLHPVVLLFKIEHAFAQLERWRRLVALLRRH